MPLSYIKHGWKLELKSNMLHVRSFIKVVSLGLLSCAGLLACDPSFTTTSQDCVTFDPVRLAVPNYQVIAGSPTNDYKLYLEDSLNSLASLQSTSGASSPSDPSEDEQSAIQFIIDKATSFLGYNVENGTVVSATNALDFVESLIAAKDKDETVQTFVAAKKNVAKAIASGDSVCNYRNKAIEIREEQIVDNDPSLINLISTVNAQLDINFNPFNRGANSNVDQVVLISLNEPLPDSVDNNEEAQALLKSFSGFSRIGSADFKAVGVSPPKVRQLTVSDADTNETFFFDDDFDELNIGQIVLNRFNAFCRDDNNNVTTCEDLSNTRTPQHPACLGGQDAEGITGPDETGQVKINNFTVVEDFDPLTDIQRLRIEVEYPKNEVRIYASKYAEAILKAGFTLDSYNSETDVIYNPTNCEKQAVLKDLNALVTDEERKAPDFKGVRLTLVEDPAYDVIETDDPDNPQEPTAVFTFLSSSIPAERQ